MSKKTVFMLMAALVCGLSGCRGKSSMHIPAVGNFDLEKYLGKWYEVCRLPNFFEEGMRDVHALYSVGKNGSIKVVNRGVKNGKIKTVCGTARVCGSSGTGELEVSFFRPFYSRYRIIKLAPDYSWAVVTGSDMKYLWVLSRTPDIDGKSFQELYDFLKKQGYPVENFIYPQRRF